MIEIVDLRRFLSGRLLGLIGSLGFQIAVVRLLPTADYARYALAIGLAALLQTITSLGLARVAAKFLSGAGERLSPTAAKTLALVMLGVRGLACTVVLAAVLVWGGGAPPSLILAGAAYTLASAMQIDADGIVLALGLQIPSRRAAVFEPLARLLGVMVFALSHEPADAAAVLWLSAGTAAMAAAVLIHAALKTLSTLDPAPGAAATLDWAQIRGVAIGGYGGTLSWLAFSPAVIRVMASSVLSVDLFAAFSFVQTLAFSLQRYAPSFTLFPLIEPAVMADVARTGRPDRLAAALSLLVKIDAMVVGAAIVGVSAAGGPIISVLAHGRYGEAAVFLPCLLALIVANASHRSYEIAAVALGAAGALTRALGLTLCWMAIALTLAPTFGVWPLLLCPLGDAVTRFWWVQRALDRCGGVDLIDPKGVGIIAGAALAMSVIGAATVRLLHTGLLESILTGTAAAVTFMALTLALRPIRSSEAAMLGAAVPWLGRWLVGDRSRPLRITVLTPRGFGGKGGVDRLMDSLRPLLSARDDVHVTFITTRGPFRWASALFSGASLIRLAVASALRPVDVIHVNLGAHGSCYRKMALIAVPRLFGTPYVLHLHGSAFKEFWSGAPSFAKRRIDRLFQQAAQVIVLGEVWRRLVADRVPDIASRLMVLPNATPLVEARREATGGGVQILFLGELGLRKGSPILLEALSHLRTETPWRTILAGDGDVAAAKRSVERLGLRHRVSLPGWIDPEAVETLLASSDILVLPSLEENLPMSLIEAFAAGLAVVATPVGAVRDILRSDETGLVVAPGDADELTRALARLIDDPALRQRLGHAAKAFHADRLALGPYADTLVHLWRSAAITAFEDVHGRMQTL